MFDHDKELLSPRAFRARLSEEVARARRYSRTLAVAVISVADTCALSDRGTADLLQAVSRQLNAGTRCHDRLGRVGPAEFGLLLPETGAPEGRQALARLLARLEAPGAGRISSSMGIVALSREVSPEGLLANARMACEQAQRSGGLRITIGPAPTPRSYRPTQPWGSPAVHIR